MTARERERDREFERKRMRECENERGREGEKADSKLTEAAFFTSS